MKIDNYNLDIKYRFGTGYLNIDGNRMSNLNSQYYTDGICILKRNYCSNKKYDDFLVNKTKPRYHGRYEKDDGFIVNIIDNVVQMNHTIKDVVFYENEDSRYLGFYFDELDKSVVFNYNVFLMCYVYLGKPKLSIGEVTNNTTQNKVIIFGDFYGIINSIKLTMEQLYELD